MKIDVGGKKLVCGFTHANLDWMTLMTRAYLISWLALYCRRHAEQVRITRTGDAQKKLHRFLRGKVCVSRRCFPLLVLVVQVVPVSSNKPITRTLLITCDYWLPGITSVFSEA